MGVFCWELNILLLVSVRPPTAAVDRFGPEYPEYPAPPLPQAAAKQESISLSAAAAAA